MRYDSAYDLEDENGFISLVEVYSEKETNPPRYSQRSDSSNRLTKQLLYVDQGRKEGMEEINQEVKNKQKTERDDADSSLIIPVSKTAIPGVRYRKRHETADPNFSGVSSIASPPPPFRRSEESGLAPDSEDMLDEQREPILGQDPCHPGSPVLAAQSPLVPTLVPTRGHVVALISKLETELEHPQLSGRRYSKNGIPPPESSINQDTLLKPSISPPSVIDPVETYVSVPSQPRRMRDSLSARPNLNVLTPDGNTYEPAGSQSESLLAVGPGLPPPRHLRSSRSSGQELRMRQPLGDSRESASNVDKTEASATFRPDIAISTPALERPHPQPRSPSLSGSQMMSESPGSISQTSRPQHQQRHQHPNLIQRQDSSGQSAHRQPHVGLTTQSLPRPQAASRRHPTEANWPVSTKASDAGPYPESAQRARSYSQSERQENTGIY
ncbi:unnamed protein product [Protopolystoma xenopodis]|uniref:Uncharacterized protein n=1 Tax=Protopolystoma xenopodis TaxID=117903 RepID=A0A3S5FDJ5_9PLAT|nr:unnamed protein product [Protopolystoma xenopodis]